MSTLPDEIQTYLLYRADARMLASLREERPELEERMNDPRTRRLLFSWLDSREARESEAEAAVVSTLLDHPHAMVRLRAFEALLIPLFAQGETDRLKPLLRAMLEDADDLVRAAGARYVQRSATVDELRPFLEDWRAAAPGRGWAATESFELVTRLLEEG
jgi:hypothetical protein